MNAMIIIVDTMPSTNFILDSDEVFFYLGKDKQVEYGSIWTTLEFTTQRAAFSRMSFRLNYLLRISSMIKFSP